MDINTSTYHNDKLNYSTLYINMPAPIEYCSSSGKKGQPCKNKAMIQINGSYYCLIHSKSHK